MVCNSQFVNTLPLGRKELIAAPRNDQKSSRALQQVTLQAAALSLPDGVILQLLSVNNQRIRLLDWLPAEAATQLSPIAQQESAR